MIHMLSKFDLRPGIAIKDFEKNYFQFVEEVRKLDLVISSGPIGQRVKNTPMDTAGDDEPEFYSIMTFKDRQQLDAAYDYLLNSKAVPEVKDPHHRIQESVENSVFTCWQDGE